MTDLMPSQPQPSHPTRLAARCASVALSLMVWAAAPQAQTQTPAPARSAPSAAQTGDYILAVVNSELVTAGELQSRLSRVREDAARNRQTLPPADQLRQQLLDALIDERVQVTYARENGPRLDDAELDRAVTNVAVQNQLTLAQLRERLRQDGQDYTRFRNNVKDQLMTERVREREVLARIRVSDADIDSFLDQRRAESGAAAEYNLAQLLVSVPEGASVATAAQRRARAETALARVKAGEAFEVVAREMSDDANRATGGAIGMRPADRLPDLFVAAVRALKPGEVAPELLRSGAGFHVLKLIEKREAGVFTSAQTRARHILLRPSAQLPQDVALRRLAEFKREIESGAKSFEQLARDNSEDGSAPQGGDLGWAAPGTFVPEFEEALNALALKGVSEPIVSRFGVHLIQVTERRQVTLEPKQQREQARNVLREKKFDEAYGDWIRELRARAYIEMREPPQ
jgi:peptidyl-prolyl cis-trans isomerase SurA